MKKRLTQPKNNRYYIRTVSGGLNDAVQGYPVIAGANVLCNCVGYANGRFNEIINDPNLKGIYLPFKYQLVCNAENFIESAKKQGLKISKKPVVGGIMVWQKGATLGGGDGAGHVAIVEEIINDNTIITSESGYAAWAFKNIKRTNNNGRWGQSEYYKFRGCIINPSVKEEEPYKPTTSYTGNLPSKTVKYGSTGTDVKYLKAFLNWCVGSKLNPKNGNCKKKTVAAIKKFQKQYGLEADGIFGSASKKKAKEIIAKYAPKEKKTAKTSKYYNATVRIGQACCNEMGTLSGGKPGDQTGREVCMGNWYNGGWLYMFRHKDPAIRLKLAQAMIDTCNNQNIGYNIDKPNRYAAWDNAENNGHQIAKINKKGDTTCSQAVSMCMRAVGISKKYAQRHYDIATMTRVLPTCPDFKMYKSSKYTASSKNLQPGDILLSSHHTLIVVKSPNVPSIKKK